MGSVQLALVLSVLACLLVVTEQVPSEASRKKDGAGSGDSRSEAGGATESKGVGKGGGLPAWFDEETMRVVEADDTFYMGYAAFIPQMPSSKYSVADDESLPLSRRINAGYRLPNTFKPGEWAPLRRFFKPPQASKDANGVVQAVRSEAQPVSWMTVATAAFGPVGRLPRMGDHMGEDPTANKGGFNAFLSPFAVTRAVCWVLVSLLPFNWVQYPYLPWKPWTPWKFGFSSLPGGKATSVHTYLHNPDLRPAPSQAHPWFRKRGKKIWVRAPVDRDRDIAADWPIWSSAVRNFSTSYKQAETALLLKGSATVTPAGGAPVKLKVGDLVTFPAGADCEWNVEEPLMMHFMFH